MELIFQCCRGIDINRLRHLKRYFTRRLERLGFNVQITLAESVA